MPLTGLLGRNGVSQVLRKNIDDLLFLINGTPQVLARIIHDGSSRNRAVATRDGHAEPCGGSGA